MNFMILAFLITITAPSLLGAPLHTPSEAQENKIHWKFKHYRSKRHHVELDFSQMKARNLYRGCDGNEIRLATEVCNVNIFEKPVPRQFSEKICRDGMTREEVIHYCCPMVGWKKRKYLNNSAELILTICNWFMYFGYY